MNLERYIASRISSTSENSFSSLIGKIAVAAIALSMTVMIITTNVITGFKNEISQKIFNFWGHIHIADNNHGDSFELVPIELDQSLIDTLNGIRQITYARPPTIEDFTKLQEPITSNLGIEKVEPYIVMPCILEDRSQFEGLLLKGIDGTFLDGNSSSFIEEGEEIIFNDSFPSRDIILSKFTANRMNFSVGQKVNISFLLDGDQVKRQFVVKGIYKTGLEEYDRRFGLVDMRILQEILAWENDQVTGLEVYVEDLNDLQVLNDFIYFELLPPATYSETVKTKFAQIFQWLELQNINEIVIITLMILVALINMITALLIFVLERTNMIGILKALGATNWSVRKIFIYNAAHIVIKGVIIGNLLAIGLCLIQKYTGILKLNEADYYLSEVPIEFNLISMGLINVGTVITVLLFMIIPSIVVTQVDPVKTIQFR